MLHYARHRDGIKEKIRDYPTAFVSVIVLRMSLPPKPPSKLPNKGYDFGKPEPKKKPPVKPLTFGKPEPAHPVTKALFWVFVVVGIGAVAVMIYTNAPQKNLVCAPVRGNALSVFGTCQEE